MTFNKKHTLLLLCSALITSLIIWYKHKPTIESGPIYTYEATRDRKEVVDLFKANWYWLIASNDFSTEFMLDHAAPNKDPRYMGHLHMNVLRNETDLMGFLAYYKESIDVGWLLFLVIDEAYRGQGYADTLIQHAITVMRDWKQVKKVRLLTRENNIKAQKVYLRNGFTQYHYDPRGFVYFEYLL